MDRVIVCIDVGTTKVCTLVAEVDDSDGMRIVGVGVVPSAGIRRGVVVNVQAAAEAILESVDKAERLSGYQVESAYVGLAGAHVSSVNSRGAVAVNRGERGVQPSDIERALDAARAMPIPHNRQVLHAIPRSYVLDGSDGVINPLGMQAYKLEVEAHIITGAATSIHNLVKCVQATGVGVNAMVLESLASGEAVLTDVEREMGVVLADIGGGTIDIAIFIEGSIWHTAVQPVGGEHVSHDVAVALQAPFTTAEELKIKFGNAHAHNVAADEVVDVAAFGDGGARQVSRRFLAEVIQARMEEIFELVQREIKRSGYDGLLPAGVVLCGGTSEMAGIRDLAREQLDLPVRIGIPHDLRGMVDTLSSPAYATGVGLLEWGLRRDTKSRSGRSKIPKKFDLSALLRAFLPERKSGASK